MVKIDMNHLEKYFAKSQLIPAIAFDVDTKTVLMLAYMNEESLRRTLETGYTWYWSRSRQELWNKGATSGHLQKVVSIYSDCDDDTLLLHVKQTGAACHTGAYSCFFHEMYNDVEKQESEEQQEQKKTNVFRQIQAWFLQPAGKNPEPHTRSDLSAAFGELLFLATLVLDNFITIPYALFIVLLLLAICLELPELFRMIHLIRKGKKNEDTGKGNK